jgi:hypothetical protein
MSKCAAQVFDSITPEQYACLTSKATAQGISITGPSGQATAHGITIGWLYDSVAQRLTLQCLSAPWVISGGTINHHIHDLVDSCANPR